MSFIKNVACAGAFFFLALAGTLQAAPPAPPPFGLLIMAHGGSPEWNKTVLDAVEPLKSRYPVTVAFGMADACSIQEGARSLEAQGVRNIGVVRLFISGESWYERTQQILGLQEGAPPAKAEDCHSGHHGSDHGMEHTMALFRIDSQSAFSLSAPGLSEAPEIGAILAERAGALSRAPEKEDILVLAHGPDSDEENQRWLANMDARTAEIRASRPYHAVAVMTLREDWPDKRKPAEEKIRAFVAQATAEGRRVIVIPFRLSGFGPYAEVLKGLDYAADRSGLLPHRNITQWIARQVDELRATSPRSSQH